MFNGPAHALLLASALWAASGGVHALDNGGDARLPGVYVWYWVAGTRLIGVPSSSSRVEQCVHRFHFAPSISLTPRCSVEPVLRPYLPSLIREAGA
jgi:hypothetical protein